MFCETGVLKIFAKCTRKYLCQSLFFFDKIVGLRLCPLTFPCSNSALETLEKGVK